ncbi:hypothetical protein MPH48_03515 [Lysinibacillus fusiformis]|uniref:hypothetical protein n=1 Tax=Lysinibacillus fusiformis TaxID=28031 RepID=UPI001F4D4D59|nr:hypothetical protein [Lysinibacillus fusiformis]MCK1987167.1 hypothetical protein [Lysinibacillus fusiformis]
MANNRIKGITIELNGDTTGLTDALKDVNKESGKVTSELKEVERALKFDPGNAELISQKQQLLAEQIQNTSQKLDVLRTAQSQVEAQFRNGEIGAEQYRAFQRELATTEAQMQQYNAQMANTANEQDRLARTTRELSSFFEATGTDVNQFADLLGTRLTSAIRDGSATTDQMNRALRLMGQHALGAGADIDQMRQALRRASEGANLDTVRQDLARITQEANQAEEAVNGFGQELSGVVAGLAAGGGIAGTVQQALDLSSLNTKIDIAFDVPEESKESVFNAIKQIEVYGVDGEEALEGVRRQWALNKDASDETNRSIAEGAAVVAKTYEGIDFIELIQEINEIGSSLQIPNKEALELTNALLKVGFPPEQLDTIAEYGLQMKQIGFSTAEIQAIFEKGVDLKTWNIDNLNDGVKEANLQMRSFGEEVPKALSDLLAKTDISTKQMQEWGKSVVAGGKEGAQAMGEVSDWLLTIEDGSLRNALAVAVFGTKAEDQGDNMIKIFQGVADAQDKTVKNQQTLQEAISTINADALVNIREALIKIVDALKPVLTAIADFASKIAQWVSDNAALTAAIVAIVTVIGILVGAFAALMPAIGGLVTAWPALAAIIGAIASPITLVVAAIVGLGIALVAAYHNSETFRENVNKVFQAIRDVAVTVFETVASFIGEKIAQIKQFWDENGTQILKAVENVFNGIKAVIEFVMPAVKFVIETVWNAIKQVIDGALNIIMGAIKVFSGLFTGDFSKMWEGVKQIFKGAIDLVVGWMTLSFFGGIKTIVMNLAKTGVNILKSMWDDIARFFTSMGSKVSSTVSNFSSAVLNFFKNLATNTGSTISNMVTSVINFVKNLATNFVNIISNMKTNVLNKMNEIKDGLINKIKSLPEQFTGIGKDIINGLIKGISAMTANAIESITGVVDGVVNTAKNLLGIHSPSRVFKQIGLWTGEGLVIGLDSSAPEVNKAMENIGNGILAVSQSYQKEYLNLIDEFNKKNEDKNDKTLEKINKIQSNAAKKKRALTQKEKQDIALLEASYRDNKMKSEVEFQKKYKALVEKSEKEYLEVIKKFIDDKKSLDEMSVVQEAAIWEQSIELFAEGSKERISAQKEYQKAVETVNKEILAINQDYQSQMQKINDDLIKQENDLTKAYEDAFTKRQSSLMSFAGLFDEFKIEIKNSGTELLSNLQSQVDGFKLWQEEFAKLSSRNIDADLLAELSDLGVKALPELMALNQLTNEQLTQYSSLYQEKSALARQQTEKELAGMKEDTDKQIIALREVASKQLDKLKTEWSLKIKSITSATSSELSSLQQIGVDAGQGLLNGLASMEGPLVSKAQQIANAISATIQQALDIHSPSRVMKGFGMNIGQGLIIGMDEMIHKVAQSSQRLSDAVSNVHGSLASNRAKSQANANTIVSSTTTIDNRKTFAPVIHNHGGANDNSRASEKMLKRLAFQLNY